MMNPLLLFGLAVAPGLAIAMYVYFRDKYEKEPLGLLVKTFLWGFLSVIVAACVETLLQNYFQLTNSIFHLAINNFLFIGFTEELCKYIVVRRVAYPTPAFNEPFDGITYAVMTSMGFATSENIMYVMEGGLHTAVIRIFTAVPAHASFAVLMGFSVGLSKFKNHHTPLLWFGLLSATMFHGAYDFFLSIEDDSLLFIGAIIALIVGVGLSFVAMKRLNEDSPFRWENIIRKKSIDAE